MKKKFIGIIYLLYSGIIIYILLTNQLKNFLAPQMQIYVKVLVIPMIIIGIVMLFNKEEYKLKITDIILLLPLALLLLAGNTKLTTSFASNRTINTNYSKRVKTKTIKEETKEEIVIEEITDFNPYFIIEDSNYDTLSSYITYEPKAEKFINKTIKVKGFALKYASYLPKGYFLIGKYSISCCIADAGFTGFIVKDNGTKINNNKWYDLEGILRKGQDKDGYDIMYIEIINIKEIDPKSEEQYIYACFVYDQKCSSVTKYDLEY
jgi:uncharacterized repeat protein (TIGR03943 family)